MELVILNTFKRKLYLRYIGNVPAFKALKKNLLAKKILKSDQQDVVLFRLANIIT